MSNTTTEDVIKSIHNIEVTTAPRSNRGMKIGETAHQGDVYVTKVEKHADIYSLNKLLGTTRELGLETRELQVAPGVTMGSRHVVMGEKVTIYTPPTNSSPLEGPTIVAEEEWMLNHPEHAPHRFDAGSYVVTFQRDWAEEMRRVAD